MWWGRMSEIQNENKWLALDKRIEYLNNIKKEKKDIYRSMQLCKFLAFSALNEVPTFSTLLVWAKPLGIKS